MNDADFIELMQQGLPPIAPPVLHLSQGVHAPGGEWIGYPAPALTTNRADGLLLGNADIEVNSHKAIHGICAAACPVCFDADCNGECMENL